MVETDSVWLLRNEIAGLEAALKGSREDYSKLLNIVVEMRQSYDDLKVKHDALAAQINVAREDLSFESSALGQGMGDEHTSLSELYKRVHAGINDIVNFQIKLRELDQAKIEELQKWKADHSRHCPLEPPKESVLLPVGAIPSASSYHSRGSPGSTRSVESLTVYAALRLARIAVRAASELL